VIAMMHDWYDGSAWWWIIPMMLAMILAVAVIVWAIARTTQPTSAQEHKPPPMPSTPEAVLAQRLAAGEIDADEYRTRLDALRDAEHR
jgi:putative membrane protein